MGDGMATAVLGQCSANFCQESKTFPEYRRCKKKKKLKTSFPRQNVVTPAK